MSANGLRILPPAPTVAAPTGDAASEVGRDHAADPGAPESCGATGAPAHLTHDESENPTDGGDT